MQHVYFIFIYAIFGNSSAGQTRRLTQEYAFWGFVYMAPHL